VVIHQTEGVGGDVALSNVVTKYDKDVRLLRLLGNGREASAAVDFPTAERFFLE